MDEAETKTVSDPFRPSGGDYVVRAVREADGSALVSLHNQVFKAYSDGDYVPRSLEEWRWRFVENPVGRIVSTLAEHAVDGVVGAYQGMPVHAVVRGEPVVAVQLVDLMVARRHRPRGPRPSLFVALGRLSADLFSRGTPPRTRFNYGLPVPNWRSGSKWLGYDNMRDWNLSFHEMPHGHDRPLPAGLTICDVGGGTRFGADVDELYQHLQAKGECATGLVKNSAYLNWRYLDRPDVQYECFEVRETAAGSKLRGVGVYKRDDALRPNTGIVVDHLFAADDADVMHAVVGDCERRGIRDETGVVATVLSPADPKCMALQRMGYLTMDMPYFVGLQAFTRELDMKSMRSEWFFTMGDFDIV